VSATLSTFGLGPVAAFSASVTWVIGSSVYAHLSKRFAPAAINFNRALVALPLFLAASLLQYGQVRASLDALGPAALGNRALWLSLSILMSYALGDVFFLWSTLSIGFPTAQAIGALYPLWAALGGLVFLNEPLTARKAAGIALAISGTITVVLAGRKRERTPPHDRTTILRHYGIGVGLALVTSLFWAMNSFAGGRGGNGMNPAFANVIRMPVALLICPIMARLQTGPGVPLLMGRADYRRYLAFFAIEAFGGSYLYIYGLSHSSVAVGATLTSLAPVVAVPVAVALGWERFSLPTTAAVLLVVGGVVLLVT
jgi:drug/metabolite transporter (DMT)-like permease